MIDLSKERVDINCPECNKQIAITLGQVMKQETISCSSCKTQIQLKDQNGSTNRSVNKINDSFKKLDRAFKSIS